MLVSFLSTRNGSVVEAAEQSQEITLPVKKISDYWVDGYTSKKTKEGKDERKAYKGKLSKISDYKEAQYKSIFTRFKNTSAQVDEDAGEGKIITKIEFLKGDEVVQTKTVNARKVKGNIKLEAEIVPVEARDSISPYGYTTAFKLVGGQRWVMWNTSNQEVKEDSSQRVTPPKIPGTNMDKYPGTFFTHFAHFPRMEQYKSQKYSGIPGFAEKWLDDQPTLLQSLNKEGKVGDTLKVEEKRNNVFFEYYGQQVKFGTDPTTKVTKLKVTSLSHAGIYFTQHYVNQGYYEPGKKLMVYASSYIYTIKAQSYRYPDRIKVYVKKGPAAPEAPNDPECTEERGQVIEDKDLDPSVSAMIRADQRGAEQFDVLQGIPTSESLFGNVFAKKFLYKGNYVQMKGKCTFEVRVNKKFTLKWDPGKTVTDSKGKTTIVPDPQTAEEVVSKMYKVERSFSYWIVDNLEVYQIDQAKLRNYAFEGEEIWISPENYDPPIYSTEETHQYIRPEYPKEVNVNGPTVNGGKTRPVVSGEEFPEEAEKVVGKMKVINDHFIFEGATIMNPVLSEVDGPTPGRIKPATQIGQDVLFSLYNMIPNTKTNKASQPSTGTIFYGLMPGNINGGEDKEYPINGINPVTVHTPVVMYPGASDDKAHNQKTQPSPNRQALILERPFTVYLPNSGQHTNYKGYGKRDYGKYIRNKQVNFPFDVYDVFGTTFYPKDTWIDVASYEEEVEFYLPVWVDEGFYNVKFRSIAENAPEVTEQQEEHHANLNLVHHIAYGTVPVDVIGRLYDFHVTDIADYNWETVFRMKKGSPMHTGNSFWVGQGDIDGNPRYVSSSYTLPLRPGSHPIFKNLVTKTGYHFKFELKTKGNMFGAQDGVEIIPSFSFIPIKPDPNHPNTKIGKRIPVDLYYHSNDKYFIKIGSEDDKESKYVILNERLRNVPQVELEDTARYQYDVEKTFAEINRISRAQYVEQYKGKTTKQKTTVGGYGGLFLSAPIRTYIGPKADLPIGVNRYRANAAIQKWYGEYSIPAGVYVVMKGTNIAEYGRTHQGLDEASPIFLKDGYIVVNFDIHSVQNGQKDRPHLQYIHGKLMNQWWQMEGFKKDGVVDPYGRTLPVEDGDIIYYDGKHSSRSDFLPMVTH